MMMMSGAAPCVSCQTRGGWTPRGGTRPGRRLDLCGDCYNREHRHGLLRTARACLSCGKLRGITGHGLCDACRKRAGALGLYDGYPACGAVPVPYRGPYHPEHPEHPTMPPALTPAEFDRHICYDLNGQRQPHALLPYAYDAPGDIAAHEAAADAWCAAHPDQIAHFDDPTFARFPAPERRAA